MNINDLKNKGRVFKKSQIRSRFRGFRKERLFYLVDGTGWIQKEHKYWYYYAYNPAITIYENSGSYYFVIDGQSEFVEVKQAKNISRHTIVNDFNGWTGNSLFVMENGEVWQQDEYAYEYHYSYRPDAIIYNDGWNYRMEVEGYTLQIKRIK